jgi:hypothetical protein
VKCVRMFSEEAPYGRSVVLGSYWPGGHASRPLTWLACVGLEHFQEKWIRFSDRNCDNEKTLPSAGSGRISDVREAP